MRQNASSAGRSPDVTGMWLMGKHSFEHMDLDSAAARSEGWTLSSGGSGRARPADRSEAAGRSLRARDSDIRLSLPARAENVGVVRTVLGALGTALGLSESTIENIRLAVTEACTNVVRHAYHGGDGAIEVAIQPKDDRLDVIVRDHGQGIAPSIDSSGPGLGLPLIAALADDLEIEHGPNTGSRLRMSFRAQRDPEAA